MNTRSILRPVLAALFAAFADSASAADSSDSARLINMATRAQIGGSAGTPIAGFTLSGSGNKTMLVRGVGPGLTAFGVTGVLADPKVSLVSGSTVVASNDNWVAADATTMTAVGAFALTSGSKDAALVSSLAPGGYTTPLTATDGGSGVALLEIYDTSTSTPSTVSNASTRAYVGTGDSVLIPGFVISGSGSLRVLIRAVGPALSAFGVSGVLADPTITLYRGSSALATNDNWSSATNAAEISAAATAVGAFALTSGSKDAAILTTLTAGSYTAVITGVGSTTGTALVELYGNVPESTTTTTTTAAVAISSPVGGTSTAAATMTVTGTSSGSSAGVTGVKVNYVAATSTDNFATWTATVPLGFGSNSLTAVATTSSGTTVTSSPVVATLTTAQTYNPLIIPDTISGTTFNLSLNKKTKQFYSGTATTTYAYNDGLFWGPTLIMNKGDTVQMNVTNNLPVDTTTTHWHGFHLPAVMDGGPLQTIPAGTTWKPTWLVKNNAGTYWYHPHLHEKAQEQVTYGGGGMIIIKDPTEAALNLPRTYGVDDFPLALTSRRFTNNQFVTTASAYGDVMLVNGTLNPQVSLPKQYVRLRLLNAEIERSYYLGFSDNRTFYVIATDGGLVDAPIPVTRALLSTGERLEVLVDLTADSVGSSFNLRAYNSSSALGAELDANFPAGEPAQSGQFGSLLNDKDFDILRINVAAATTGAITTRPTTLTTNKFWAESDVTNSRTITLSGGPAVYYFNNDVYSATVFNQTVKKNAVEKWTITNTSNFSHTFHIHDVQFTMISRTRNADARQSTATGIFSYEKGWKDTIYVQQGTSVSFIAKFEDYSSSTSPFMYHCHFANHEDEGLMGQFVVVDDSVAAASSTALMPAFAHNDVIRPDELNFDGIVQLGAEQSRGLLASLAPSRATENRLPLGLSNVRLFAAP